MRRLFFSVWNWVIVFGIIKIKVRQRKYQKTLKKIEFIFNVHRREEGGGEGDSNYIKPHQATRIWCKNNRLEWPLIELPMTLVQPNLTPWPVLTRVKLGLAWFGRSDWVKESQYGLDHETIEQNELTGFMSPISQWVLVWVTFYFVTPLPYQVILVGTLTGVQGDVTFDAKFWRPFL